MMVNIDELKRLDELMTGGRWEPGSQRDPQDAIRSSTLGVVAIGIDEPADCIGVCYLRNNTRLIISEIETLRAQLSQATAKTRALETEMQLLRVELDRATAGL